MKRIIGFLTVICMVLSFCPAAFAGVKDYTVGPDALGIVNGSGVAVNSETVIIGSKEETVVKYANYNGYFRKNFEKTPVTGVIYSEFKMMVTNDSYEFFRLQHIWNSKHGMFDLDFTPQRENGSITSVKLSKKSTHLNTNVLSENPFEKNEWITVRSKLDMTDSNNMTFDLSIGETVIYQGESFTMSSSAQGAGATGLGRLAVSFNTNKDNYTGPAYFKDFNVYKMLEVTSINAIDDKDVDIEDTYTLPATVDAVVEGKTDAVPLAVTWALDEASPTDGITIQSGVCSFTKEETYIFKGTVAESDKTVTLKVNVTKLPEIVSLEKPANGEAEVNVEHTLPSKVTANYDKGDPKEVSVTWSAPEVSVSGGKCTFTEVGTYDFEGTVDGTDIKASYTVVVNPLSITGCDKVDVYLEKTTDSMPKTVKVQYRDGSYGYEEVAWSDIDRSADEVQTVTGTIQNYAGAVTADIKADVYLYETNDALFEEICDYEDGELIRWQQLSPEPRVEEEDYWGWSSGVHEGVIAKPDPINSDNMAIYMPVNTSTLTTNNYSAIEVGTGREGISVISFDMLFPDTATDFRTQMLSENSGKVIEHAYDGSIGKMSGVADTGAFEPGEWVNFKWIVNMYTDTYDVFINNVKLKADVAVATAKQKNVYSIRFANNSTTTEGTAVYIDNVRMYHLTAMLEDDYEEIKLTDTNVTGNLSFNSPADNTVTATWESADTTLIENDGTVHQPAWKSGDKNTKVTLKLEKPIGAGYSAQKQATFDLVVKEASPTDAEAVNATLEWLSFDKIKKDNTAENNILTDLELKTEGLYEATISWSSTPSGLIDSEGKIYAPESADTPVTLTATVSKGSVSLADTPISLTVKYQAELSDLQAVRRAKAALTIGDTVNSSNTKLSLPSSGANGVSIAWKSLDTDKLSDKGEWQKPSSGGTAVMQAILTKGEARDTKNFNVTVAAYSGGGGGSGSSGGSSGGGGSAGAMVAPSTTPVTEPEEITPVYSDIEGYDWAHTAIYALTNAGVLTGTGNKKFEPARNVKREEFVAMAVRGFDITADSAELPFTDVSESDWHYETTKKAYSSGLVSGISEDSFGSGMEIKRQDMFVIMYNAAKELGISLRKVRDAAEFTDSGDISEYALEAVNALYEAGIVNGYGDSINPLQSATRAEAAKMIYEIRALYTK